MILSCRPVSMLILLLCLPLSAPAAPRVVTSILPVHSLVSGVMDGIGEPELLLPGGASPHGYSLRPSDMRALTRAHVMFWIGPPLESVLVRPIANAAGPESVELLAAPGVERLARRRGGVWDEDGHEHGHDEHDDHGQAAAIGYGNADPHIWLDPHNAMAMVEHIAQVLSRRDAANAQRYRDNARDLRERLAALDRELAATLAPVREVPYVVFHDAYGYFEHRYGLAAAGSISVDPERLPGARRVKSIRDHIRAGEARCVFSEPQFRSDLIGTLVEGTGAGVGVLDPLGAELTPGAGAYFELLRGLAGSVRECLDKG